MTDVLTAGHVNWDVTLRVDELPAPDAESFIRSQRGSGGGSAANVAVALSGLAVAAGVVGSVGDDQNGLLARRELREAGVERRGLRTVEGGSTAVKYLLVDDGGEVAVLGNDGANEAVAPGDVDAEYVRSVRHVHLTSQRPDTAERLADLARDAGIPVSVDPGRRLGRRDFSGAVERADLLFLNEREADTALDDPETAFPDKTVVVKRGAAGATVYAPDGTYDHDGFDVEPVDTTGAGDAFAAGFLATGLDGAAPERKLAFGNACGALAARAEGARTAPSREAVEAFLAES